MTVKKVLIALILPLSLFLSISFTLPGHAFSASDAEKELAALKKEFGPVLRLRGTVAAAEINAIANLLTPKSGMMAIDFTHASGEFCMLEPDTKRYMLHFSRAPQATTEDILYFLNPEPFKSAGLKVSELPPLPAELGKMKPLTWYYYDGKTREPHHGRKLGREFLVMAIDVK